MGSEERGCVAGPGTFRKGHQLGWVPESVTLKGSGPSSELMPDSFADYCGLPYFLLPQHVLHAEGMLNLHHICTGMVN